MLAQDRQPKKNKHVPDIIPWRRPPHGGASTLEPMTAPPPWGGEQKGAPYGGTHHKLLFIILSTLGIATEG